MLERIEERVARRRAALPVDYSRRSVLAHMTDSKAYADCFGACAERNQLISSYHEAARLAWAISIGAMLFGGLACIGMLVFRHQPIGAKIGVLILALAISVVIILLLRELVLNKIARKIARVEEHIDAHYAVRPVLVDKVQYELHNALDDISYYGDYLEDEEEEDDEGLERENLWSDTEGFFFPNFSRSPSEKGDNTYMDSPFSEGGPKFTDFLESVDEAKQEKQSPPEYQLLGAHWDLDEPELARVLAERVVKISEKEPEEEADNDTIKKVIQDLDDCLYRLEQATN